MRRPHTCKHQTISAPHIQPRAVGMIVKLTLVSRWLLIRPHLEIQPRPLYCEGTSRVECWELGAFSVPCRQMMVQASLESGLGGANRIERLQRRWAVVVVVGGQEQDGEMVSVHVAYGLTVVIYLCLSRDWDALFGIKLM